ncbi:sensor histidine kinase [Paenibacillus agricola]|uniref:Sensor histidine kinase n=1 Tax=Paenibacillus agricola TaxID=2716264 RepID=A0ABX0J8J8_9BACL|nr:sensor histidine kinase [Paenibacillus agricola]NHN32121.1 sensor histidine kinase [Paenibacillus agricola]
MKPLLFPQMSFKNRIWLSYLFLILIAVSSSGTLSHIIAANVLEKNVTDLNKSSIRKSALLLDERLRKITVTVMSGMLNDSFTNTMKDIRLNNSDSYYGHFADLQGWFMQIKVSEPSIESLFITTPMGDFYPTTENRLREYLFVHSDMHRVIEEKKHNIWIPEHTDLFFSGKRSVISLVMEPLIDDHTRMKGVYIIVNINVNMLMEALADEWGEPANDLYLMTGNGTNVLTTSLPFAKPFLKDSDFLGQISSESEPHFAYSYAHNDYLIDVQRLRLTDDWILAGVRSTRDLYGQVVAIQWATAAVIGGCGLLALFFSRMLTSYLLRPLAHLVQLMKKVEASDLTVRFTTARQDEFALVGNRFNRMLEEIEQLIVDMKQADQSKRVAEMKALQAQINPHFLYNTLYTIYWKAELAQYDDVKEMTFSLSQLFQLGLNHGQDMTTVEKEVTHVTEYMNILKRCYEDWFEYEIEVEEGLRTMGLLKLLLQPLVENTIQHGFQDRKSGGHIRISVYSASDEVFFIVEDNGSGMDAEQLMEQIKAPAKEPTSYALRNIYERLQLYYGVKAGFRIESTPGVLTKVVLSIPSNHQELEWGKAHE